MKRFSLLTGILIGILAVVGMGATISQLTTFQDGDVLTASQLNAEFGQIISTINSLDDGNIAAGANIDSAKIEAAIAGDGIGRNGATGVLEVNDDNVTLEITGDVLQVKDGGIDTTQIADDAVTTVKILDANVTRAKLVSVGQQISSSSGLWDVTNSSTSYADVTNLSVTITTTGRPVVVRLIPDESGAVASGCFGFATGNPATFRFLRGATDLGPFLLGDGDEAPCSSFSTLDTPSAGTYTYKFQHRATAASSTTRGMYYAKLVAYEL